MMRPYWPVGEKQYSCPHGNGIWYDSRPTYSWNGEPKHYRNKFTHPYNYDAFYLIGTPVDISRAQACYSDRYRLWDVSKFKRAMEATGDARWDRMTLEQLDAFVKVYHGKSYMAVGLVEWCNQSSGYPVWSVHYKKVPRKKKPKAE